MRPIDRAAVQPYLRRAISDIERTLSALDARRKIQDELCALPPGRKKPARLTPEQQAALLHWRTLDGDPLTAEQRQEILADLPPGRPTSDEEWEDLRFLLRGGWQESAREAADWLLKVGEPRAADGIYAALSALPSEPRDHGELPTYRAAVRRAAEDAKAILQACLDAGREPEQSPAPSLDAEGFYSPSRLAELFSLPEESLRKRLERWRRKHAAAGGWLQDQECGPHDPSYLYRLSAIRPILDEMIQHRASG